MHLVLEVLQLGFQGEVGEKRGDILLWQEGEREKDGVQFVDMREEVVQVDHGFETRVQSHHTDKVAQGLDLL